MLNVCLGATFFDKYSSCLMKCHQLFLLAFRYLFKRAWLRQRSHVSSLTLWGQLKCAKKPQMAPDSSTSITEVRISFFKCRVEIWTEKLGMMVIFSTNGKGSFSVLIWQMKGHISSKHSRQSFECLWSSQVCHMDLPAHGTHSSAGMD